MKSKQFFSDSSHHQKTPKNKLSSVYIWIHIPDPDMQDVSTIYIYFIFCTTVNIKKFKSMDLLCIPMGNDLLALFYIFI